MLPTQSSLPARDVGSTRNARWTLAALVLGWSLVATAARGTAGVSLALAAQPESLSMTGAQDELGRLLVKASSGRMPSAAAVDAALTSVTPVAAGRFTSALRTATENGEAGAAELLALVSGFPRRTLEWAASRPQPPSVLVARVDIGLAILQANPADDSIATATALAGERLIAPDGAREARRRLQAVLEAALSRDERGARSAVQRAFVDARAGLEPAIVDALRAVVSVRRFEVLTTLLGERPGADGLVLNRMYGLALRVGPVLDEMDLWKVRGFLESSVAFERVGAARALGALEDRGAVTKLIALLRDTDSSVRNAAHDALRRISAMPLGPAPERWTMWLEREEDWWSQRGAQDLARVGHAEPAEVLSILSEAAHHRLYRDEIAAAALPLLDSADSSVVRMGLAALESVHARGVELRIIDLLEHPSTSVRQQAAACLRGLTGQTLPADAKAWRRALDR